MKELDILWHSIGMRSRNYRCRLNWWLDNDNHRNNYCAEVKACPKSVIRLVELGYMDRGRTINDGQDVYFHVTTVGISIAREEFWKLTRTEKRRRL